MVAKNTPGRYDGLRKLRLNKVARMPSPFVYRRRVEFADTDMAGIAHFSRMFCYMEEAEHAFLRSVGLSVHEEWDGRTISWPRLSAECQYRSPVRFEEMLDITVRIAELKRKTVRYEFEAKVADRQVATGTFVVVCCEVVDHQIRSIEIPPHIQAKLH